MEDWKYSYDYNQTFTTESISAKEVGYVLK